MPLLRRQVGEVVPHRGGQRRRVAALLRRLHSRRGSRLCRAYAGDLFPERLRPATDAERREARERARIAQWQAALEVLCKEAAIVNLAQKQLVRWQFLSEEDDARLQLAETRIANARNVLCPPPARFRPEVVHG